MRTVPRTRHYVSPGALTLCRPLLSFDWEREAYTLRAVGGRFGPVLRPDRRSSWLRRSSRSRRYDGPERRGADADAAALRAGGTGAARGPDAGRGADGDHREAAARRADGRHSAQASRRAEARTPGPPAQPGAAGSALTGPRDRSSRPRRRSGKRRGGRSRSARN